MRLFLLILIVIALASCGRRNRNRNRKPDQGKPENDHEKESTIENNGEKQERKEKIEEKEEEKEEDDSTSHRTCLEGSKFTILEGSKVEETCKTGLNDNCVMMYFGRSGRHPWDDSMKVYGCSDKYNCKDVKEMMDKLSDDKKPAEFYCKTCKRKYDKCNGEL